MIRVCRSKAAARDNQQRQGAECLTKCLVFDDMWVTFRLSGDGFENCPYPIGTKVKMRLLHNFHIRGGLIAREIAYEIWGRDE
jgi:hypothetical protein